MRGRRRALRQSQTKAESKLWSELRNSQIGFKFKRQQSVGPYVVDFYCCEKKLAIELDGSVHDKPANKIRDQYRSNEPSPAKPASLRGEERAG